MPFLTDLGGNTPKSLAERYKSIAFFNGSCFPPWGKSLNLQSQNINYPLGSVLARPSGKFAEIDNRLVAFCQRFDVAVQSCTKNWVPLAHSAALCQKNCKWLGGSHNLISTVQVD